MEDPRNITFCTHMMFCAKNIERIGDHATNIAETVYYIVEGQTLPVAEGRYHQQRNVATISMIEDGRMRPMTKPPKIEPVNIELYEKAWARTPAKKQSRRKKNKGRRGRTKKK